MARKPVKSAAANAVAKAAAEDAALTSAWQTLDDSQAQREQATRSAALESQALRHAECDDAASACWYLCRSLGLARQLEPGEPSLELLFELIGALADLPANICATPLQASDDGEQLGISELCQQLAMAREQSHEVWVDADLAAPSSGLTH